MSKEKMTDAELAQLRIEIAYDYLAECKAKDLSMSLQEENMHLGLGVIVAQIAIWKIFRQDRFEICKKTKA